jgi:hypothetical protein
LLSFGAVHQVEQNAEPAAQAASDQAIRPAGKAVAENARPTAKAATDNAIRPAGQAVSDNAVPVTKSAMRDQVGSCTRRLGSTFETLRSGRPFLEEGCD